MGTYSLHSVPDVPECMHLGKQMTPAAAHDSVNLGRFIPHRSILCVIHSVDCSRGRQEWKERSSEKTFLNQPQVSKNQNLERSSAI